MHSKLLIFALGTLMFASTVYAQPAQPAQPQYTGCHTCIKNKLQWNPDKKLCQSNATAIATNLDCFAYGRLSDNVVIINPTTKLPSEKVSKTLQPNEEFTPFIILKDIKETVVLTPNCDTNQV